MYLFYVCVKNQKSHFYNALIVLLIDSELLSF